MLQRRDRGVLILALAALAFAVLVVVTVVGSRGNQPSTVAAAAPVASPPPAAQAVVAPATQQAALKRLAFALELQKKLRANGYKVQVHVVEPEYKSIYVIGIPEGFITQGSLPGTMKRLGFSELTVGPNLADSETHKL